MRCIIPIRGPEIRELDNEYQRLLREILLINQDKYFIKLLDFGQEHDVIEQITFSLIPYSKEEEVLNEEIVRLSEIYKFLRVDLVSELLEINLKFKEERYETSSGIVMDFIIKKLSLILHLTFSTKIDFLDGLILSEKNIFLGKTELLLNNIDYAFEHSLKIKWPIIKSLSLNNTIKWFEDNNLKLEGNSGNKLHRAINAFSYVFSKIFEKDTSNLFWTMLGIETLLAEGSNNIISQIKIKSTLILGEPQEYKKKLNKLYDYRSRFVHGDIDFPAKFSSDYEMFESEYWDYLYFSTSILLALIRELIVQGKSEFKFEYIMTKD